MDAGRLQSKRAACRIGSTIYADETFGYSLYISIDHKGDEARTSKPQENKGVGHHGQQGSVHPTSRVLVPEER